MADDNVQPLSNDGSDEEGPTNYKPPAEKTLQEIVSTDQEDESLRKYKETLLGNAAQDLVIVDPDDPRKVIVKGLALVVEGREDMVLDLSHDLDNLKKSPFAIKEGIPYKIRIDFFVQREIVTGLKYVQKIYRHGLPIDKMTHMIGSYPPKTTIQSYLTPQEEMPSGLIARGSYSVKSLFTDDDKNEHLRWEWAFDLKKGWKDDSPTE